MKNAHYRGSWSGVILIIWNFPCALILEIVVSYPNTKFKRFGNEPLRNILGLLSIRGNCIASTNETNFGLPKVGGCVPKGEIQRGCKFVGCADAI